MSTIRRAMLLALTFSWVAAGQTLPSKLAVPNQKDQTDALKAIHAVYKDSYAKRDAASQTAFAETLRKEADETRDDPVSRFVLLRESRDIAASEGDVKQAMLAADELSILYDLDLFAAQRPALDEAAAHANSSSQVADVIEACRTLAERAIDADRPEIVTECGRNATRAAERVADPGMLTVARDFQKWTSALTAAAARSEKAEVDLQSAPDDPEKNLIVGRYYSLTRGDFLRGLPFLSKSGDSALKSLAASELSMPTDSEAIVRLADGWWAQADKLRDWEKIHAHAHAAALYKSVLDKLSGLTATRIKVRIEAAGAEASSPKPTPVELLQWTRLPLHPISGQWKAQRGMLVSGGQGREIVAMTYQPPEEYDLSVDFMRLTGDEDINLIFQVNGSTFMLDMGGWNNRIFGVDTIGGKRALNVAASTTTSDLIPVKQKNTVIVHIRRSGFSAELNGKFTYHADTDYSDWALDPDWRAANGVRLGVATQNSSVTFQSIRIIEISGTGSRE